MFKSYFLTSGVQESVKLFVCIQHCVITKHLPSPYTICSQRAPKNPNACFHSANALAFQDGCLNHHLSMSRLTIQPQKSRTSLRHRTKKKINKIYTHMYVYTHSGGKAKMFCTAKLHPTLVLRLNSAVGCKMLQAYPLGRSGNQ